MNLYNPNIFPKRLRELRKGKKMTQRELAKLLNVSINTISCWETNKQEPNRETYAKIAEIFDVTVDFLFGRIDSEKDLEYMYVSPIEKEILKLVQKIKEANNKNKKA